MISMSSFDLTSDRFVSGSSAYLTHPTQFLGSTAADVKNMSIKAFVTLLLVQKSGKLNTTLVIVSWG